MFPKVDIKKYTIKNDEKMILDLLLQKRVLLVQGTGFGYPKPDHFRVVFLPQLAALEAAIENIAEFFTNYNQIE